MFNGGNVCLMPQYSNNKENNFIVKQASILQSWKLQSDIELWACTISGGELDPAQLTRAWKRRSNHHVIELFKLIHQVIIKLSGMVYINDEFLPIIYLGIFSVNQVLFLNLINFDILLDVSSLCTITTDWLSCVVRNKRSYGVPSSEPNKIPGIKTWVWHWW